MERRLARAVLVARGTAAAALVAACAAAVVAAVVFSTQALVGVGRQGTDGRMVVRRAHDELEHGRDVARIAVRGRGERPLLQEVAREEAEC